MSTSTHSPWRPLRATPEPVTALSSREVRRVYTQSRSLRRHMRRLFTLPLSTDERAEIAILLAAHAQAVKRAAFALKERN